MARSTVGFSRFECAGKFRTLFFFFSRWEGDCLGIEGQEMAEVFKDVSQESPENAKVRRRTL